MVKVTIEYGEDIKVMEGDVTIVLMPDSNEMRTEVALAGTHGDPTVLLMRASASLGVIAGEIFKDPFERVAVIRGMTQAMIDTLDDDNRIVKEQGYLMKRRLSDKE